MIKKILLISLSIFVLAGINLKISKVYAADQNECTLTITPNKKEIQKGEELLLTIKASNIKAGKGIIMYSTIINFNEEDFSFASKNEVTSSQGWSNFARIENSITFYRSDYLPNSENQEIGTIKLIANKNVAIGDKSISFTKNEFVTESDTGEQETLNNEDIKLTVKITNPKDEEDNNQEEKPNDDNNNSDNNNSENDNKEDNKPNENNKPNNNGEENHIQGNNSNDKSKSPNKQNTISDKNLPKTGIINFIGICCIILIIVSIVLFIKYKRAV